MSGVIRAGLGLTPASQLAPSIALGTTAIHGHVINPLTTSIEDKAAEV